MENEEPYSSTTLQETSTEVSEPHSTLLPPAPDWLLDNIAAASKKANRVYTIFIGVLAYCALTVINTTDRQLLLNEPAKLPVLNVQIDTIQRRRLLGQE